MRTYVHVGAWVVALGAMTFMGSCGGGGGGPDALPLDTTPRLHQLYAFRSVTNANNTVFILTLNAGAGVDSPTTFSPTQKVRLHVDTSGSISAVTTFEATFGAPGPGGIQTVSLSDGTTTLAQGNTGVNLPVAPNGMFRAALQDDPFFLDQFGLDAYLDGGPFPWGGAVNAYGPNENCLAIVLEIPSNDVGPVNSLIYVWATIDVDGTTIDRRGRAMVFDMLVEPVPRGTVSGFTPDSRPLYRANDNPNQDVALFGAEMPGVFTSFYNRTLVDAAALSSLFLPDALVFQLGNPNGLGTFVTSGTGQGAHFAGTVFGNGRRLRDDVVDIMINIFTNGLEPTDGVPDDNGTRITDGNMGTIAAFPYIGAPNP